jgi:3-(methylthio)propionyl---CoA ligase
MGLTRRNVVKDHAAINHPERRVVSRSIEGPVHSITYAQVCERALKCAQQLARDGIIQGDRVATLAWNTWRHLEACSRVATHRARKPKRPRR